MGSLSNLNDLASRLEESFDTVKGAETAGPEMDKVVWPQIQRNYHYGPNDALWKRMHALCGQTLRKPGEAYPSYEDWVECTTRLWLTICSTRHLLVKWADINPKQWDCNLPRFTDFVELPPKASDFSAGYESRIDTIETIEYARLDNFGVTPAPPLDVKSLQRRLRTGLSIGNLAILYEDKDRTEPVGILDYDVRPSPPVTPYKKLHSYAFNGHEREIPVVWNEELTPTRLFALADYKQVPQRYDHDHMAVHMVLQLVKEAHGRGIPLVARDKYTPPTKGKP